MRRRGRSGLHDEPLRVRAGGADRADGGTARLLGLVRAGLIAVGDQPDAAQQLSRQDREEREGDAATCHPRRVVPHSCSGPLRCGAYPDARMSWPETERMGSEIMNVVPE